jgi:RNA polymerase sigma-70 factor (sigma-E family)
MTAGGHWASGSHEDELLSRLYRQVTELQESRFRAGYDLAAGLDRYRTWLREHTEDHAPQGAAEASGAITLPASQDAAIVGSELVDEGARPTNVTETLVATGAIVPDAFVADGFVVPGPVARAGWSADRAVTELYSVHYRALVRLAALLVRDVPTAEEVVQDAFVAMHGGWQRLRDAEKALAYLRQAVVNRSRSVLRHRTVVDKNLQKAPPDMPSAEHGALVLLERSAVVAALRGLPGRQREAIVLRYYADLSEAEIAATMGISRGAVKSHTARGMSALRAALEQE